MRPHVRVVLACLTAVIALAFVVVLLLDPPAHRSPSSTSSASSADTPSASGFDGAALPVDLGAPQFTLTALAAPTGEASGQTTGDAVSLSSFHGQVVVLAFLYSTCGPTCVVIAQQIRGALNELSGHSPAVLIVSADPAADTPARVRAFLADVSLTGRVHYLTGSSARLHAVWQAYRVTPASAGATAFDTAAVVYLIDRRGDQRVEFGAEQLTPEGLAHDIGKLQGK